MAAEDLTVVLRLLSDRRDQLSRERNRIVCRLHDQFRDLRDGGAKVNLTADQAARLLKGIQPVGLVAIQRRQLARELLADLRRVDKQMVDIDDRIREAVTATRTSLTDIVGIGAVLAATIIGHTGDITRFADRGHEVGDRAGVLVGRCVDVGEEGLPFAPVAEVLRQLVRGLDDERLAAVLGAARFELARLVPQLSSERVTPAERMASGSQATLFSAVLDAFQQLAAEQPLVVAFEDLHWADASTLSLLRYLAGNLRDARLLVVGTLRTDELHRRHPRRQSLGELARVPGVTQFLLEPLSRAEVAAQVASLVEEELDPVLVDEIATRSEGNPFFVEELLAEYREHGRGAVSGTLRDVLLSPLGSLPERTRRLVDLVAAAGRPVGHRPAVDRHLLVEDDDGCYTFRHALSQEAVYGDLLASERVTLHREIAEALSSHRHLAAGGSENVDAELAHHWDAAKVPSEAFRASQAAAERSQQMGAHAAGLGHYERALALWEHAAPVASASRVEVHAAAADAAHRAGDYTREARHLDAALAQQDPGASPTDADLRRRHSLALYRTGDGDGAMREIRKVLALGDDALSGEQRALALAWHARGVATLVGLDAAQKPAHEALEAARRAQARHPESIGLMLVGGGLVAEGHHGEGIDYLERARQIAEEDDDTDLVTWAYHDLLGALVTAERHDEAQALLQDALVWLDAGADREAATAFVASKIAWQLLAVGRWEQADQVLAQAERHQLTGPHRMALQGVRTLRDLYRGRCAAASEELAQARRAGATRHRQVQRPWFDLDALREALEGDVERVRSATDAALTADPVWQVDAHPLVHLARSEVDASLRASTRRRVDRLERARQALKRLERLESAGAGAITRPWALVRDVARARAELSRGEDPDPAVWRGLLGNEPHVLWRIYDRWRLAEALLATGTTREATQELRQAHHEAEELGAELLQAELEDLARRAGVDVTVPETIDDGGPDLTPRELDVLRLVARGQTNKEIGEELFIAPKTASAHLSNILGKLGVDNRVQAAAVAHQHGIGDDGAAPTADPAT